MGEGEGTPGGLAGGLTGGLAVLLTAAPPAAAVETAWRLARAAVARGRAAGIFMMDDGVHAAAPLAERAAAEGGGVGLVRCVQDARQRRAADAPGVLEGSQADWARMVAEAARVLSLG